jgi:hypothetical protein
MSKRFTNAYRLRIIALVGLSCLHLPTYIANAALSGLACGTETTVTDSSIVEGKVMGLLLLFGTPTVGKTTECRDGALL